MIQAAHGDLGLEQGERLADHARGCGVNVERDVYRVTAHVFHLFWPCLPEAATALEKAAEFIRVAH